jgi:hypothetical protein
LTSDLSLAALAAAGAPAAEKPAEFPFVVIPPEITFLTKGVQPPSLAYIGRQSWLTVVCYNSWPGLTLIVDVEVLRPSGELQYSEFQFSPPSDRSGFYTVVPLSEGFLLTLVVRTTASCPPGACYCQVFTTRTNPPNAGYVQTLATGYICRTYTLGWPQPRWVEPAEGPGRRRVIIGTDPPAGSSISETVPTGARWKLTSLRCSLATDATAITRYVSLYLVDPSGTFLYVPSLIGQTAATTFSYTWTIGTPSTPTMVIPSIINPLPDQVDLLAGQSIGVIVYSGTAGDNLTAPLYCVEEWVEP